MRVAQHEMEAVTALRHVIAVLDAFIGTPMESGSPNAVLNDLVETHGGAVVALASLWITALAVDGVANHIGETRAQLWADLRPQLDQMLTDRAVVARLFLDD